MPPHLDLLIVCSMVLTTACSTGYMPVENKKSEHIAAVKHIQLGPYEAGFFLSAGKRKNKVHLYVNLQLIKTDSGSPVDIQQTPPVHIDIHVSGKDSVAGKDTISYRLFRVDGPQKVQDVEGEQWVYAFVASSRRRFDRIVRITLSIPSKDGGKPATIQKSFLMKFYRHVYLLS